MLEGPSAHQKHFFPCEGDQIVAQVSQGNCAVSIPGDIPRCGPELLVLGGPA